MNNVHIKNYQIKTIVGVSQVRFFYSIWKQDEDSLSYLTLIVCI